jgi:hypothetical protein
MSAGFVEDLAGNVRGSVAAAATSGLAAFGAAAALAVGELSNPAFVQNAASGADTLAAGLVKALGTDLVGRIAHEVDANGLSDGDVRIDTQLVAFASGEVRSPVADAVVEHAFAFTLPNIAGIGVEATLTLKAECAFAAKDASPKISTTTKIEVKFDWSSVSEEAKT